LARFTVILDACVLVPIALADTLLRIAERELYRPLWSERILAEAMDAIIEVHPDADPGLITKRFAAMSGTFEEALVTGWESLEAALTLPDPDDRHVVAAAIAGRADAIVTANLRDYPASALTAHALEAVHPDDFLLDQLDLAPRLVMDVLTDQAEQTRRPALTTVDLLARLGRAGVPRFASEAGRLL
jgi:predicted nucleic acid-binding protein